MFKKGYVQSEEHKKRIGESNSIALLGKKHTEERRKNMSLAQKGDKGNNWKGGKTKEIQILRISLEYRLWRTAVFERDNYTCIWCRKRNGKGKAVYLEADHIKPFASFPELRFAIDNGRTLCKECHRTTDTYGNRSKSKKYGIE
jgi:5-methylcytosine-specific restriction endonuclease McrA